MKYLVKFNCPETKKFYKYEGKLATHPIIKFIDKYNDRCYGKLVDIGCGDRPYINYFKYIDKYIGVDIANDKADIIANAKSLPIKSNSVDLFCAIN